MKARIAKIVGAASVCLLLLLLAVAVLFPGAFAFFASQTDGIRNAGTWEDDPQNWYRAFNEPQPDHVKVVRSKYWKSNHFTHEFIYYFEIEATQAWRDSFLAKHALQLVPPSEARGFRSSVRSKDTPEWFAPDPVELYETWDRVGRFGSVWINKTNGHIFFYDMQL